MTFIDVNNTVEFIQSRKYALFMVESVVKLMETTHYDDNGNDYVTHIDETSIITHFLYLKNHRLWIDSTKSSLTLLKLGLANIKWILR